MDEIAVLLATYNGGKYLTELLDSLLKQTYPKLKIYIHDDGSCDETVSVIHEYQAKYPSMIQVLIYPPTGSSCANFMSMLTYVKESYVMFCDQDDVWLPEKTEKVFQEMQRIEAENPDRPCLVFSDLYVVDSELKIISDSFMRYADRDPHCTDYKSLLMQNVAPGCTMILNRELVKQAECCCDATKIGMHDIWVILIAALEGKVSYVDMPLICYRQHQGNVVGAQKVTKIKKIVNTLQRIFSGSQGAEKKEWLNNISVLADVLNKSLELKNEDKIFLDSLADIPGRKKTERIKFYFKNGLIEKKRWWLAFWI